MAEQVISSALQLNGRPVSQMQLATEVKLIYSGLLMVEEKCIAIDQQYAKLQDAELRRRPGDSWSALIALHRTLLHEHHDFFLATQHPSGSPALRQLSGKYDMPNRLWKHAIYDCLEILRRSICETSARKQDPAMEHFLHFFCIAYQMVALLYETVPAFKNTWTERLGDLARYRMAVEDSCRSLVPSPRHTGTLECSADVLLLWKIFKFSRAVPRCLTICQTSAGSCHEEEDNTFANSLPR